MNYASGNSKILALSLVSAMLLVGCSDLQYSELEKRMDLIEGQVVLPEQAMKLEDYARFYAYKTNGDVQALYRTPVGDEFEFHRNEIEDYCATRKSKYRNCLIDYKKRSSAKAGDRFWLEDHDNLPFADDGGCGIIQFSFQSKKEFISTPECNGGGIP